MDRACVVHGTRRNAYKIVVTGNIRGVRKRVTLKIVLQSLECKYVVQEGLVVGWCEYDNVTSYSMNCGECLIDFCSINLFCDS